MGGDYNDDFVAKPKKLKEEPVPQAETKTEAETPLKTEPAPAAAN